MRHSGKNENNIKRNDWLHGYRYIRRERLRTFVLSLFLCMVLILSFTIFSEFTIMTRPNMLEIYEQETSYSQITRTVWDLYPEGSTEATLARNVRILCWIMTMPENHDTKALAVKKTWGERCNILLFVSSTYDRTLPSVPLVNKEGREYLWSKTVAAFNYIHRKGYLRDVDWVLKADDDTFVVMENLRLFLSDLDPDRALYMGLLLKWPDSNPYMAGGPGYVLSRTSARRLVEEALPNGINCSEQEADFEDIEMGKCMTQIDAEFVDTRDEQGRNRFHADQPDTYMAPGSFPDWYRMAIVHNISKLHHGIMGNLLSVSDIQSLRYMACGTTPSHQNDVNALFFRIEWLIRKASLRKEQIFAVCVLICLFLGLLYNFMGTSSTIDWLQEYEQQTLDSQIRRSVWELYPEDSNDSMLARKVRVLCWVMTNPSNHDSKALAVKNTWGQRCNILLFISSTYDPTLPSIPLVNHEGRGYLWTKTVAAFKYVYRKGFLDDVDWVLKADDDTFIVMENLRLYLNDFDPNRDLYFGFLLKWPNSNPYMAGGPGYVLSRTSARRFVEEALSSGDECSEANAPYEDVAMGRCMLKINAEFVDTRDEQGRNRFHNNPPVTYMGPDPLPEWYEQAVVHKITKGIYNCCADATISFHYIQHHNMYQMYYNTYRLHPVSIQSKIPSKNKTRKRRKTDEGRSRLLGRSR